MNKVTTDLRKDFSEYDIFTTDDLYKFYNSHEPDVNRNTVNWRVYELVKQGILQRVGKGKFILGKEKKFSPVISAKESKINKLIIKEFPYVNYCIWSKSIFSHFFQHLSVINFIVVEVEKEALDSVYFLLKENYKATFKKPKKEIVEDFILQQQNSIIINSFVSEAPIQKIKNVPTSSLEKILVDLYCEKNLLYFLQGSELVNIYKKAFGSYTVNQTKLLRYADRRRKKQEISEFVNFIFRQ